MGNNNYFKNKSHPLEQNKAEDITNLRTREINRLIMPDGTFREFVANDNVSFPDGQGGYLDGTIRNIYINEAGHPLPDDLQGGVISTTGIIIPTPVHGAECTSSFHPRKRPRNIYIGVDGSNTETEAICNICRRRRTFFQIMLLFPVVGWIVGIMCYIIWSWEGRYVMKNCMKITGCCLMFFFIIVMPVYAQRQVIVFGLDETGSYDLREKGLGIAARLIANLKPGDVIYIRTITESSYHDGCAILRLEIPELKKAPQNRFDVRAHRKHLLISKQINVIKKQAIDLLQKLPPINANKTDIHGFFAAAADRFKIETTKGDCRKFVILSSDMQDNCLVNTQTNLSGAKVIIAGFQVYADPFVANRIKAEWNKTLIKKYNADSVSYIPADYDLNL